MVRSLIRFGYLEDSRLQRGINWITTYQRFDDRVDKPPTGWPYDSAYGCWGKHICSMGAVKALKALSEIPEETRSSEVKETIVKGVEYFLQQHVHKRSHAPDKVCKPGWLKFGFPLMYQTDALEILGVLTKLGYHDKRMQEAIDLLISKQDDMGRWTMENTFNGRFQVNIESRDRLSKWVTLNALRVLKACGLSEIRSQDQGLQLTKWRNVQSAWAWQIGENLAGTMLLTQPERDTTICMWWEVKIERESVIKDVGWDSLCLPWV